MRDGTRQNRFSAAFLVLAITAAVAIALSGWALYGRFQQTNALRAADKQVWHAVICTIEKATVVSKEPHAKKIASLRFFDGLLVRVVKTSGCDLIQGGKR